jgi:hypothetical protein
LAETGSTEASPVIEEVRGLTFTDGFQFGCGFAAATALGILIVVLLIVLIAFVLSLLGISVLNLTGIPG